jgi:2-polyprenyl-3-methyl-5-hydroxy-6-metoxy-1,4-benzoquinol methylase
MPWVAGQERAFEELGDWYHRIDLRDGRVTPGDRNQALVFDFYRPHLPSDLTGLEVLDLGANAGGLSVEFAARGAQVLAIETRDEYLAQAEYVVGVLGLQDQITLQQADFYDCFDLGQFDIVCFLGLVYHLRHPQLALDMLGRLCRGTLLASSQTIPSDGLVMQNRATRIEGRSLGAIVGWEPTEELFREMIAHAGFRNPRLVSRKPHVGESPGNICGNRSYFIADAGEPRMLPFLDRGYVGDPRFRWQ